MWFIDLTLYFSILLYIYNWIWCKRYLDTKFHEVYPDRLRFWEFKLIVIDWQRFLFNWLLCEDELLLRLFYSSQHVGGKPRIKEIGGENWKLQFSNLSVLNGNERTSKTAELMMQLTQKKDNFFTTSFRVMRRIIIPSFHVFT